MLGKWHKTVDGMYIYIVDYENRLMPQYDEETAKKITQTAQELSKWLHEFLKENNIKFTLGNEDINS
jgi:glycogen debranching enzyme